MTTSGTTATLIAKNLCHEWVDGFKLEPISVWSQHQVCCKTPLLQFIHLKDLAGQSAVHFRPFTGIQDGHIFSSRHPNTNQNRHTKRNESWSSKYQGISSDSPHQRSCQQGQPNEDPTLCISSVFFTTKADKSLT